MCKKDFCHLFWREAAEKYLKEEYPVGRLMLFNFMKRCRLTDWTKILPLSPPAVQTVILDLRLDFFFLLLPGIKATGNVCLFHSWKYYKSQMWLLFFFSSIIYNLTPITAKSSSAGVFFLMRQITRSIFDTVTTCLTSSMSWARARTRTRTQSQDCWFPLSTTSSFWLHPTIASLQIFETLSFVSRPKYNADPYLK